MSSLLYALKSAPLNTASEVKSRVRASLSGAEVNVLDARGISPYMYALFLSAIYEHNEQYMDIVNMLKPYKDVGMKELNIRTVKDMITHKNKWLKSMRTDYILHAEAVAAAAAESDDDDKTRMGFPAEAAPAEDTRVESETETEEEGDEELKAQTDDKVQELKAARRKEMSKERSKRSKEKRQAAMDEFNTMSAEELDDYIDNTEAVLSELKGETNELLTTEQETELYASVGVADEDMGALMARVAEVTKADLDDEDVQIDVDDLSVADMRLVEVYHKLKNAAKMRENFEKANIAPDTFVDLREAGLYDVGVMSRQRFERLSAELPEELDVSDPVHREFFLHQIYVHRKELEYDLDIAYSIEDSKDSDDVEVVEDGLVPKEELTAEEQKAAELIADTKRQKKELVKKLKQLLLQEGASVHDVEDYLDFGLLIVLGHRVPNLKGLDSSILRNALIKLDESFS